MTNRNRYITITRAMLPILAGVAFAISAMTHEAPTAGWSGTRDQVQAIEHAPNIPSFTKEDALSFPRCTPTTEGLTDKLVVLQTNEREVVSFTRALALGRERMVWVIGSC